MNAEIGRVGFADRATRQSRSRQGVSALTGEYPIAQDVDLTAIMRREGIRNIHWDALLDRFSVTTLDYGMGMGGSVGEALSDARRRA